MKNILLSSALMGVLIAPAYAQNHDDHHNHDHHNSPPMGFSVSGSHEAHDHSARFSPISVMGDHLHEKGDWMVSYRFMRMEMEGNRDGTNSLSPQEISGVFTNPTGVGPATLRIVPTEMTMDMHMVSAMYGLNDDVTLMVMGSYIDKDMDHVTFAGMNAANQIGGFTTTSKGFGDTKLAALINGYQNGQHQVVLKAGISLPTGSIDEEDEIFDPTGATVRVRLPYAMQIGSGTYDFEPALTYTGHQGRFGWGAQYMGQIRLDTNDEDYSLGDKHMISAWGGYKWADWLLTTARVTGETEEKIDGRDSMIGGPVQTADPDNYGGQRVEVGLGFTLISDSTGLEGHNFGGEFIIPIHQDLNGPQLERDYAFTLGYQYNF